MIIKVNTKSKKYNIIVERALLSSAHKYFDFNKKLLIVTDDNIPSKYIKQVKILSNNSFVFTIKNGEKNKNINNYIDIMKYLIDKKFNRNDMIIALGGGVVGDLSGFVASTYMRGIKFINIPTSLLSQVDSSVGGKTAIDFQNIKNVIGSFYQPDLVLIDPNTLSTLNKRHLYNGLVEAIKISATFDKKLFNLINNSNNIYDDIEDIIIRSVKLKKSVVEKDEKEINLRKVLNFGHTIGHGIEESCNNKYLHGECVGVGMLYFSSDVVKNNIMQILQKYNLPTKINIDTNKVYNKILHDKKAKDEFIECIYVDEIGKYQIKKIKNNIIKKMIDSFK